jgi:hypothetical protein
MEKSSLNHPDFVVPPKVAESLQKMVTDGRTVKVVGRVKNGKLEIDPASLAELNKTSPHANLSFVAVNAPFKTKESTVEA